MPLACIQLHALDMCKGKLAGASLRGWVGYVGWSRRRRAHGQLPGQTRKSFCFVSPSQLMSGYCIKLPGCGVSRKTADICCLTILFLVVSTPGSATVSGNVYTCCRKIVASKVASIARVVSEAGGPRLVARDAEQVFVDVIRCVHFRHTHIHTHPSHFSQSHIHTHPSKAGLLQPGV